MSTYSPDLRIELISTGDQAGTWGNTTNTNLGTIIEDAISGYVTVPVLSANQAFTVVNGAVDEARNAMIRLTTTTGNNFSVYAPPVSKQYIIWNNSGYSASILNSTVTGNTTPAGAGTSVVSGIAYNVVSLGSTTLVQWQAFFSSLVAIPVVGQSITATATGTLAGGATVTATVIIANGEKVAVFSDGTNFYPVEVAGIVGIAHGGTGTNSFTANGVLYAPTTTTLSNGSNFVFDGTNVGIGASSPSTYGKFVVGGTGSFTNSFVSTSATVSDKPTLEFRKTANTASTGVVNNQIGRISFYSQQGSTTAESAYISARDYRVSGISLPEIKLAAYSSTVTSETNYISIGYNGLTLYSGATAGISYTAPVYTFADGGGNFTVQAAAVFSGGLDVSVGALTVASVPVVTTTGSQTLTNKTLGSGLVMAASAITSKTALALTPNSSVDFTSIPSWVKRITIMFQDVSLNGASVPIIQIGSSGTVVTTGYTGTSSVIGAGVATGSNTTGFFASVAGFGNSTYSYSGAATICLHSGNLYVFSGTFSTPQASYTIPTAGYKSLAGVLDILRITTANGTDTFDSGTVNILYE